MRRSQAWAPSRQLHCSPLQPCEALPTPPWPLCSGISRARLCRWPGNSTPCPTSPPPRASRRPGKCVLSPSASGLKGLGKAGSGSQAGQTRLVSCRPCPGSIRLGEVGWPPCRWCPHPRLSSDAGSALACGLRGGLRQERRAWDGVLSGARPGWVGSPHTVSGKSVSHNSNEFCALFEKVI